jgi:hypothetical protein
MHVNSYNFGYNLSAYYHPQEKQPQQSILYCYEKLDPEEADSDSYNSSEMHACPMAPLDFAATPPNIQETSETQESCFKEHPEMMEIEKDSEINDVEKFSVDILEIDGLYTFMQENVLPSPQERLDKLKSLCTYIPAKNEIQNEYWNLWVEIPKNESSVHMNLIIEEDSYHSQCLAEWVVNKQLTENSKYHYIKASVEDDDKTFYFQIRIEPSFLSSEILHIQQAESLSGTEVKKLCLTLLNYIKPSYAYLHDDAKKIHEDKSSMALRMFLPVVSDEPKTWYSSDGFTLAEFEELINEDKTPKTPQNLHLYKAAVHLIRNIPIKDLVRSAGNSKYYSKRLIETWINRYVNNDLKSYDNCTVHELGKAMFLALRNQSNTKLSNIAENDFKNFYTHYLGTCPSFPREYREALSILATYQLWFKEL